MSLTDLMSNLGLSFYPIVALVIFVAVFVTLMIRLGRTPASDLSTWSRLPMEDETSKPAPNTNSAMEGAHAHG